MKTRQFVPSIEKPRSLLGRGRLGLAAARYLVLLGVATLFVLPLVKMLSESLRPLDLPPPTVLEWWPPRVTLANYPAIFALLPFGRYAANSAIVVAVAVPLTILTASWAGFALSQLPARARNFLTALSIAALLVPLMSLWLTRFLVFKWLGVLDTLLVLMLPAVFGTSPFYVLMLSWAFRRIPTELFDAARVDGCGAFRIWWSVALPLVRPALTAVAVLSFVFYWSNFIDPLLYISNQQHYTLPVALQALQQMHRSRWPLLMAGCVVVTLPVLLVFLLAQRYFLQEHRDSGWLGQ